MSGAAVALREAGLSRGGRPLWSGLSLDVRPGEFLTVLGPNGAGKSSLLRVLLGLLRLTEGSVEVCGQRPRRGSPDVGWVPQQRGFDVDLGARGRDLVRFGADGHRWGSRPLAADVRRRIDAAIADVGATDYADAPVGRLSGGEQQRLRLAQALLGDPRVLLCDEPLLSLDLQHQRAVVELIDRRRRTADTAVLFVTHEVNPVLPVTDRVLYLVHGRWAIGTPSEVMTGECLSDLYGAPVDVLTVRGRLLVVGAADSSVSELDPHEHEH